MPHQNFQFFIREYDPGYLTNSIRERLDIWSDFTIIMRFNKIGSWNLEVPKLTVNGILNPVWNVITPKCGIVVVCDGQVIFSGTADGEFIQTPNSKKISGSDDNILLRTPARPTPSLNNGPYPDAYDVTTGVASTIMRSLVNRNIGPSAPSAWKIASLLLAADPLVGSTITARARFDPLIVLLSELASTPIARGLGFRILQSNSIDGKLEFSIYVPRDKHNDTKFSVELNTAQEFEYIHRWPDANYFIVGGGDNFGINRTVLEGGDATSITEHGRRNAVFVDRRGVENTSELAQELAELIAGAVSSDQVTVLPMDNETLSFVTDYNLGDYVTAVVEGVEYPRIIREIEINFNPETGPVIKPVIADPLGTNDELLTRHFESLANRVSNIERNWNVPQDSIINDMLHPTIKWMAGDIKITGRSAAQLGWLICDGSAVSRTTYSTLFAAIGTLFGAGNGSTTFNVPNVTDKYIIGKGITHALGASGGSAQLTLAHAHPHFHTHAHDHAGGTHTHPLAHSHGLLAHIHVHTHTHEINDTHNHGANTGFNNAVDSVQDGVNAVVADDLHTHSIADDNMFINTSNPSTANTGAGVLSSDPGILFNTTQSDSNVGAAVYTTGSGPAVPDTTASDSSAASPTSVPFDPPNTAFTVMIWTGVIPV